MPQSAMYNDEADDPYITLPGAEDSDEDDLPIKPDDLLILAAKNEDDVSHLEVWLYEPATDDEPANLYVHHDVMLPAFPLAVEWLDLHPERGTQVRRAASDDRMTVMHGGLHIHVCQQLLYVNNSTAS